MDIPVAVDDLLQADRQARNPDQDQRKPYSITAVLIGHGYGDDTLAETRLSFLQEICRNEGYLQTSIVKTGIVTRHH